MPHNSINGTGYGYHLASGSNRLQSITGPTPKNYQYDANGNIIHDCLHGYDYDARNRLTGLDSGIGYRLNGLGQRVAKTLPPLDPASLRGDANNDGIINGQDYSLILDHILGLQAANNADCNEDGQVNVADLVCINIKSNAQPQNGKTHFVYDEQGQLIGEYDEQGNALQETLYLDNLPVAVLKSGNVYYIHADHLNTPRVITDAANTVYWSWLSDPFGSSAANEDVDGDGNTFAFNLRFPGQYFDEETGLHYNYFRDYDPGTGRYVQSDPIGLIRRFSDPLIQLSIGIEIPLMDSFSDAVINHAYGYAQQNPMVYIDLYGLLESICKQAGYQACNRMRKQCNALLVPAMGFSTMGAYACGQFCDVECRQEVDDFCVANPDKNEPPPPTPPTLEDLDKYKP